MASAEIQVFVRGVDGKTYTLDILPSDTIREVKRKFAEKAGIPLERVGFDYGGHLDLEDGRTAASYGIEKESELKAKILQLLSDVQDREVLQQLKQDLLAIYKYDGAPLFVFIGIASYDAGHGEASVKRQQCPDALLTWCKANGWDLTVMLIDPGFGGGKDPQIYDQVDQGWISAPFHTEANGKIRHYTDAVGQGKHVVITYATEIPEYVFMAGLGGPSGITDRAKIDGFPLNAFKAKWGAREDRCLVSGNFFNKPTRKDQYITIGNLKVVAQCGFDLNP